MKVCLNKKKRREYQLYIFLTTLKTANQQMIFTKVQVSRGVTLIYYQILTDVSTCMQAVFSCYRCY